MSLAEWLAKSGPYIGPRGGKYADPDHKIPWQEGTSTSTSPGKTPDPVMGTTASGKTIYASPKHPSHKNFTVTDHYDAAVAHQAVFDGKTGEAAFRSLQAAKVHMAAIKKLRGKTMSKSLTEWLAKSGGPYFGPKGGKYVDPQHKIPWTDEHSRIDAHRRANASMAAQDASKAADEASIDASMASRSAEAGKTSHRDAASAHTKAAEAHAVVAGKASLAGAKSQMETAKEYEAKHREAAKQHTIKHTGKAPAEQIPLIKSIPGASDTSIGETGRLLPTDGPRTTVDTRSGGGAPAEVSRPEDGGRVNGAGANAGAWTLKDYVAKTGLGVGKEPSCEEEKLEGDSPSKVGEIPKKHTLGGSVEGSADIGQDRSQGGPAYGPNTKKPASAGPMGMDGISTMAKSQASPIFEEARRLSAIAERVLRAPEARVTLGGPPLARQAATDLKAATVLVKGGVVYTTIEDQTIQDLLEKSGGHIMAPQVGRPGAESPLLKAELCKGCGGHFMKALTSCPHCGKDTTPPMAKSQPTTFGRLRPAPRDMIDAKNGLSLE